MKEETREHKTIATFALLPPKDRLLRLRGGINSSTITGLPTVVMESHAEKRRKHYGTYCRQCIKPLFLITGVLVLLDMINDYLFVGSGNHPVPPMIQRDYSQVNGIKDLSVESVSTKCFHKKSTCKCTDPTKPIGLESNAQWARVFHNNKEAAEGTQGDVDVVFLGDSIMEGWKGMSWGRQNAKVHNVPKVFESYFSIQHGGNYQGLPLGIAGDASPNLLWRIQNGELPDNLNPPVIWILIGTNDFGNAWCSAEMVLIGIIRLVEELRLRKPGSIIVINGILPRTYNRQGFVGRGRSRKWWRITKAPPAMPSLWDDIEAVNEELKNYAESRDKVEYFETNVFLMDKTVPEENLMIDGKLMPDFLHPSAEGYKLWGQEIVDRLKVLIPKR